MAYVSQHSPTDISSSVLRFSSRVTCPPPPMSDVSCLELGQAGYTHYLYGASVVGARARNTPPENFYGVFCQCGRRYSGLFFESCLQAHSISEIPVSGRQS